MREARGTEEILLYSFLMWVQDIGRQSKLHAKSLSDSGDRRILVEINGSKYTIKLPAAMCTGSDHRAALLDHLSRKHDTILTRPTTW